MFKNRLRVFLAIALMSQLLLIACGPERANAGVDKETLLYLSRAEKTDNGELFIKLWGFAYMDSKSNEIPIDESVCLGVVDHTRLLGNKSMVCANQGEEISIPINDGEGEEPFIEITMALVGDSDHYVCGQKLVGRDFSEAHKFRGNYCILQDDPKDEIGDLHTEVSDDSIEKYERALWDGYENRELSRV